MKLTQIPPTAVGGCFILLLQRVTQQSSQEYRRPQSVDCSYMAYTPHILIAHCGYERRLDMNESTNFGWWYLLAYAARRFRPDMKEPPTAVGGIPAAHARAKEHLH